MLAVIHSVEKVIHLKLFLKNEKRPTPRKHSSSQIINKLTTCHSINIFYRIGPAHSMRGSPLARDNH